MLRISTRTIIHCNNLPASIFNDCCSLECFKQQISSINHVLAHEILISVFKYLYLMLTLANNPKI